MQKALSFVIKQFPRRENLIRKHWQTDEDFEELCEHFTWMSEAAEFNPNTEKGQNYASLRAKLKEELQVYLKRAS